jgi:hypothetical protein
MCACVHKSGRGFFEGVCAPSTTTFHLYDLPPPLNSRTDSGIYPAKVSITGRGDDFP